MTDEIQEAALKEFRSVRCASNFRHNDIIPPFDSALEMPLPTFDDGHGWFSPYTGNKKFEGDRNGFIDFNISDCTGDTKKWKFKYLMETSEYNPTSSKPPEWSRDNFSISDTRPNNPGSSLGECGNYANSLFINGRGQKYGNRLFRVYTRRDNNLSNRFMWGVMEGPVFAKNEYVTHSYSKKSHHVRASAITFRYKVHFQEDKKSALGPNYNDRHGGSPIESFCLAYVKKGSTTVHLAECIAVNKRQIEDGSPYPPNSGQRWLANYSMGSYNKSTTDNNLKVWDEHGPYQNPTWETNVEGVATLTVSTAAANKIWDEKFVCVGFVATSVHSSRGSGYVGSSMWFDMYDVKLLEMERRGQNDFAAAGGEEDPKFTRVLRPSAVKSQNLDYYNSDNDYFTLDLQ